MTDQQQNQERAWRTSVLYERGDVRRWGFVRLVCGVRHFAGHAATDPWDPGWGWSADRARALWTPRGVLSRLIVWAMRRNGTIR